MIQHATRRHADLLTTVKRRKLKWYWHVSRSSGLAKTIFVREATRRERQLKDTVGRQRLKMLVGRTGLSRVTEGCGRQTEMEAAGQRVGRTGLSRVTEGCGRQTEMEAAGQRVGRTGLSRVTEGCGRQTEMEAAGCEVMDGAPTTPCVKGQIDKQIHLQ